MPPLLCVLVNDDIGQLHSALLWKLPDVLSLPTMTATQARCIFLHVQGNQFILSSVLPSIADSLLQYPRALRSMLW